MSATRARRDPPRAPAPRADAVATRARIVGVAERLFADHGIDATTLAGINKAAGQRNRSAVQYHFGNKEGVIHAILDKHTPLIEQRRNAMLDAIESSGRPKLRDLVEALVLPVADALDDPDGGVAFVRINAQLIGHPSFALLDLHARRVNRGAERLQGLLAEASPHLPRPLWVARWLLVIGLLFHGMADYAQLLERADGAHTAPGRRLFVGNLVDALVALIEAPASAATTRELNADSQST